MLVQTFQQRVWRRSSIGLYGFLKMAADGRPSSSLISLTPPKTGDLDLQTDQLLRLVKWAPTGNGLAYVDYNNNVHYR